MPIDIKICGLTTRDDARAALEAGADYVGFVVYPKSPRHVSPTALRHLLEREGGITRAVGVFVNMTARDVATVADDCGLVAVQVHGDEDAAGFAGLARPVWRAVHLRSGTWQPAPEQWPAARYVVDATVPGQYGGTGVQADWDEAARLARARTIMLSGGLTPENVAGAIRRVRPTGVDVSSGVELSPGRKDHAKVAAFIQAARAAVT
ncbi:MAG: phosphoribosylanthranilate isomerase [Lentisphaerae bacterium]|nr:phosphoribosylanthranilate isomerase [Lentisphaerota bacterium]